MRISTESTGSPVQLFDYFVNFLHTAVIIITYLVLLLSFRQGFYCRLPGLCRLKGCGLLNSNLSARGRRLSSRQGKTQLASCNCKTYPSRNAARRNRSSAFSSASSRRIGLSTMEKAA